MECHNQHHDGNAQYVRYQHKLRVRDHPANTWHQGVCVMGGWAQLLRANDNWCLLNLILFVMKKDQYVSLQKHPSNGLQHALELGSVWQFLTRDNINHAPPPCSRSSLQAHV